MILHGPMNVLAVVQSEEVKDSLSNVPLENNNVNFDVFVGMVGDVGLVLSRIAARPTGPRLRR